MEWEKKGIIHNVIEKIGWAKTHAQVPTLLLKKDRLRVYFATRPQPNVTMTSFCDLDLDDLSKVIYVHDKPILELGEPGTFDQHGIMPSSIVEKEGIIYLYYSGWSRSVGVPYSNYTGLALSDDGGMTFKKSFKGPVLDRTKMEIFSATSPEVFFNGDWHMWYCSGTNWHEINGKYEHTYDIKYAVSDDGYNWKQNNKIAISQIDMYEAITKPTVIELFGKYHMWYCHRGSFNFRNGRESYKLGYADSIDMINWNRKEVNQVGIFLSEEGWDSEMQAYPAALKIQGDIYLFYNGNSFGRNGFGYAKLKN